MIQPKKRDLIAVKASEVTGYSYEYCRMVRNGNRSNESIECVLVEIAQRERELLEAVKKAVPFDLKFDRKSRTKHKA